MESKERGDHKVPYAFTENFVFEDQGMKYRYPLMCEILKFDGFCQKVAVWRDQIRLSSVPVHVHNVDSGTSTCKSTNTAVN